MEKNIFDRDIQYLKGVGEKRARAFRKLKIRNLGELLEFYPRAYEDRREILPVERLVPGEFCSFAAAVTSPVISRRIRQGMTVSRLTAADGTGQVSITFFNQPYVKDSLREGETYLFYGKIQREGFGFSCVAPEYSPVLPGQEPKGAIIPIYPLSAGLGRKAVSAAVANALDAVQDKLEDQLPEGVIMEHALARYEFSLRSIHAPASAEALELARRRLVFEELFSLSAGLFLLKGRRAAVAGEKYIQYDWAPFFDLLPFSLTGAQLRAISEAAADMCSGRLTNRLIQGDVGSGKTIVAAALAYLALKNGAQAAIMAPTEVLAAQHANNLAPLFDALGFKTELLTGSLGAAAKRAAHARIAAGDCGLVIGTSAVISQGVEYSNLGLVVCDEQHRFGVAQRAALSAKGQNPHMLIMSATPIPRTLALIMYGDLDVSVIDELPPGRMGIDTFLVGENMRKRIEAFVRKQISLGHQVYIVCPLIDEDDSDERASVTKYAESIGSEVYPDLRVGFLHGRMKPKEKDAAMADFSEGRIDILVSTTVIEVGVDNKNATLMVVENAERFGLAQLHQLRGRVGRGGAKSYCVLFCSGGEKSRERMEILTKTNDGYKIAEHDLALRGPGNFFGSRQHGLPGLKLASLSADMSLLKEAQDAAGRLLAGDPALSLPENRTFREKIARMFDTQEGNTFN